LSSGPSLRTIGDEDRRRSSHAPGPEVRRRQGVAASARALIDRTDSVVTPLACGPGVDARRAYRLIKGDGSAYDLAETEHGPQCDCPDSIFRRDGLDPDGCKHVQALVRLGLIGAADMRVEPRLARR